MSTTIAATLVAAASYGFLGTVFARDAFFSLAVFTAFWAFIFADLAYPAAAASTLYIYVPSMVLVAAVAGAVLVKLLGTGRLIDVWMTRSPLPLPNLSEDWNIPLFLLALAFAWLTAFFAALAAAGSLWYGLVTLSFAGAVALAIISGLLLLLCLVAAGFMRNSDAEGNLVSGGPALYYFVAFLFLAGLPALFWHFIPITSSVTRGLVTALVALVVDAVGLYLGYRLERGMWRGADVVSAKRPGQYDGLDTGADGWVVAVRIFAIGLFHGGIFAIGGLVDVNVGTDAIARQVYWVPYLMLYFFIITVLAAVLYAVIVCIFWNNVNGRNEHGLRWFSRAGPATTGGRVSPPTERLPQGRNSTPVGENAPVRSRAPRNLSTVTFV